ncbi:MAG: putative membrane protein [Psychromonas sp.]|jgi:putative membrane protein
MTFEKLHLNKRAINLSIGLIWLFHISGLLGITLGYQNWFVIKTAFNLSLVAILFLLFFPVNTKQKSLIAVLFFIVGFGIEWVGVHNDFLFGAYEYGENFGSKFFDVPWLIGVNWMLLAFVTGALADKYISKFWLKVTLGAFLMVFLDFFMEVTAPIFDFWIWEEGHAPLRNYITWFCVSFVLQFLFQKNRIKGNTNLALHIYLAQLVFFVYFYVYNQS